MNKTNRFAQLLELYLSGNISADEHEELFDLISTHKYDDLLGRSIQKDMSGDPSYSAADLPPHIAEEIVRNIFHSEKSTSKILPLKKTMRYRWWAVAASLLFISITAYFLFSDREIIANGSSFTALIPDSTIMHNNEAGKSEVITLEDGSVVTLQPGSKLHYARRFDADKREVFLEGEAFFRIAKNPSKPFLVYYNNIVTRVLGTSFHVNTNSETGDVEVSVKSGKVQVYENERLLKGRINKAIILTPNQKLVYKPLGRLFETQLVEYPEPLLPEDAPKEVPVPFVYEGEKLLDVFKHIEKNYGIEIVVENTNINNCEFTGDVSSQDLYTKLKFICLATNASYEINGTKILIKGNGCKPIQ